MAELKNTGKTWLVLEPEGDLYDDPTGPSTPELEPGFAQLLEVHVLHVFAVMFVRLMVESILMAESTSWLQCADGEVRS